MGLALCFQQENYSNTECEGINSQGYLLPPPQFTAFFLQACFYIIRQPYSLQIELEKGWISLCQQLEENINLKQMHKNRRILV